MSFVCGVDLGGTTTKIVFVDPQLRLLGRESIPTNGDSGPESMIESLDEILRQKTEEHGPLRALGVAMAGLVDSSRRIVEAPNLTSFVGFDLQGALRGRWVAAEVVLDNDVNCAIVGEHRHGAGRGYDHLCMVSLGTGVGGAVIIDGHLFRGAGGLAGELGHLVVDLNGPECTCGRRGHVEAHLSTRAFIERANDWLQAAPAGQGEELSRRRAAGRDLTPAVVTECARSGDSLARSILAESGRILGAACASIAHCVQPQKIIIGGGVSMAGQLLLEPTREAFAEYAMESVGRSVELGLAELGMDSAAIGASRLALDRLDAQNSPET